MTTEATGGATTNRTTTAAGDARGPAADGGPVTPATAGPPPSPDAVDVGTPIPPRRFVITRADLIRYAGASGDTNRFTGVTGSPEGSGFPVSSHTAC